MLRIVSIGIIGSGNLGSALAKILSGKHSIILYDINKAVIDEINSRHTNDRYLPGVSFNRNITATTDMSFVKDIELIILAVPSQVASVVCTQINRYYAGQTIVSASKGLSKDGLVITDIIHSKIKCNPSNVLAISGPCIAKELASGKPTLVMLGGNRFVAEKVRRIFETESFFINITSDKKGIQFLGFYKNIIAIVVGLCDGLGLGHNFESSLVTKAYNAFYTLNTGKNIHRHTFVGPAGLGDLYVTAMSPHSRNRTFGYLIGKGMHIDEVKKKIGQTIEGYENLLLLSGLKDKSYIDENLMRILLEILHESRGREHIKSMLLKYLYSPGIKNIIFDWGNVLTKGNYSSRVASRLSKIYRIDAKSLFRTLEREEKNALLGDESFQKYFRRVKRYYPMMKYDIFLESYKRSVTYDKDMISLCKELKKDYKLYLLSNNYSIITPILKRSVLSEIFDGMIFSNDVHLLKPHRDIFEYTLEKFSLIPKTCLFVDDSGRNVIAAKNSRMNAVKFVNILQFRKELKKMIVC